jgi:hypothetical protein
MRKVNKIFLALTVFAVSDQYWYAVQVSPEIRD